MSEQVTLEDVAQLSGVSLAAASRALNGRPGVRDDVRRRVSEASDRLGFRPNRAARHLASGRSQVIGLVIPSAELRVDPYGASMTHAVGRAATRRDHGLMLHLAADEPGDTVHHILRDGLLDGLLISTVAFGHSWVEELVDARLPTMLIGTHPTRHDVIGVDVENLESSAAAVTHLFEQGCRRVATITGRLERADARLRVQGYRLAHQRVGREVDESFIVRGDFGRESGSVAARRVIELGADGVFAANDEMAQGAMWTFARAGVRVPDDVAIVGFDGTAVDEFMNQTLSTMCQPFDEIAGTAVDQLLAGIAGCPMAAQPILLQPRLVVGGSSLRVPFDAP
ncbi:MAG: LacI family DNA-binding transcriptional regulator [Ilumatobacteraceae bacterium]